MKSLVDIFRPNRDMGGAIIEVYRTKTPSGKTIKASRHHTLTHECYISEEVLTEIFEKYGRGIATTHGVNILDSDNDRRFESITGEKGLVKIVSKSLKNLNNFLEKLADLQGVERIKTFELGISPEFKILEREYMKQGDVPLNVTFFDIEVDRDPEIGFASPENPYAPISAITLHNKWEKRSLTFLLAIEESKEKLEQYLSGVLYQDENGKPTRTKPENDTFGAMTPENGYLVFENEMDLIFAFLKAIGDGDVISGWNSEGFDIPYMVHRIIWLGLEDKTPFFEYIRSVSENDEHRMKNHEFYKQWDRLVSMLPKEHKLALEMFSYPGLSCMPKAERKTNNFGKKEVRYRFSGRIHLDYMHLYRKFIMKELHSYSLDNILNQEVNLSKIKYKGTLDELYRNNIRRFTAYSRMDVDGLVKIDEKRNFIGVAEGMSKFGLVTIDKVLGTVALVEGAIHRKIHSLGKVIPDKENWSMISDLYKGIGAPGAIVFDPIPGLHEWMASYDVNSLYPTTIRMLNLSPETISIIVIPKKFIEMDKKDIEWSSFWSEYMAIPEVDLIMEGSEEEIHVLVPDEESPYAGTSAFIHATVEAKDIKQIVEENENLLLTPFGVVINREVDGSIPMLLGEWYEGRKEMRAKEREYGKLFSEAKEKNSPNKDEYEEKMEYYKTMQTIRKLLLNSTYGSLLNKHCHYFSMPLGASVTMSGRSVVYTMAMAAERLLNGSLREMKEYITR